jgi:hypothetical protein
VNGNNTTGNLFLVDGVNNNDIGSNRTILIYPSVDAIQEFKILRNSYGPEYGQAQGAIISIVTQGGTNQWHGKAYYFGRNDALTATDFFNTRTGQAKDTLRRNDWGYTIGGPVVKDKLFFFFSEEWNREKRGKLRQAEVPTAAEAAGDFSADLPANAVGFDKCHPLPSTGATAIPAGQLSLSGAAYVAMFPTPNITPVGNCLNWAASLVSPINWREENARVDWKIGRTWSLMGRYTHDAWSQPSPSTLNFWGDDNLPSIEEGWSQPAQQATVKLTKLFGSTAVNDFQFSFAGNKIIATVEGTGGTITGVDALGVGGPQTGTHLSATDLNHSILTNQETLSTINTAFPIGDKLVGDRIGYPGFWGGGCSNPCPAAAGQALWNQGPWKNNEQLYIVKDDFSKVLGAHTFKLGFIGTLNQKNEQTGNESSENAFYWGASGNTGTGNGVFDLLWNQVQWGGGEQQTNPISKIRWRDVEFYYGDNWKLRRNLTLDYGVRWSFLRPPYSASNLIANFVPSLYDPALGSASCNGLLVTDLSFCQGNNISGQTFAGGTVSTIGKGLKAADNNAIAPRIGLAWDPKGDGKTSIRAGVGQFYQRERLNNTLSMSTNPPFNLSASFSRPFDTPPAPSSITAAGNPTFGQAIDSNLPNTWQWNLTAEREIVRDTKFQVAYVANKAIHILQHRDPNIIPQALRYDFATHNSAADRPLGNGQWGSIQEAQWSGSANYHSLQSLFLTQTHGVRAQFAYTWSKSLTDSDLTISGGQNEYSLLLDPNNSKLNYGPSLINRPHTFVGSIIYDMPSFTGRSAFMRYALGSWELSAIPSYATGTSLTVDVANQLSNETGSTVVVNNGGVSGAGQSQNNVRPNRVAGQSCYAHTSDKTQFLNPAAWTMVGYAIGSVTGDSGIGECKGPGIANTDFSVYKNFKVTERVGLQFRMEFFNVFNKVQFLGNSAGGNFLNKQISNNNRVSDADPFHISSFDEPSTFGQATRDKGPREIQYALKITF